MHEMKRHAVCLAVLVVSLMQEFEILYLEDREVDLAELAMTLD
jgi:hypothetical protein